MIEVADFRQELVNDLREHNPELRFLVFVIEAAQPLEHIAHYVGVQLCCFDADASDLVVDALVDQVEQGDVQILLLLVTQDLDVDALCALPEVDECILALAPVL